MKTEEQALGRPFRVAFQHLNLQENQRGTFERAFSDRTERNVFKLKTDFD